MTTCQTENITTQRKQKINACDFEQSILIRYPEWDICSLRQRTSFGGGGITAVIILNYDVCILGFGK